MFTIKNTP